MVSSVEGKVRRRALPALAVMTAAVVMAASAAPWLSSNHGRHTYTVLGMENSVVTAFGIGGWATFAGGLAVVILSAARLVAERQALRLMAFWIATGTMAVAVYELIRVLLQIHHAHHAARHLYPSLAESLSGRVHLGHGLVILCVAAVMVWLTAMVEAVAERP